MTSFKDDEEDWDPDFEIFEYRQVQKSDQPRSQTRINSDRLGSTRIVSDHEKKHKMK